MPDVTPAQQLLLARHRPALFRLMDAGALADVVELLVELDRFAARSTPPRTMTRPTRPGPAPMAQTWEQLLSPAERHEADRHDAEPHGLAVMRSLDVMETWLAGSVKP